MRIAIVNDNHAPTVVLRHIVETQSAHEVAWTAADGAEAVKRCAEDTPDLILMDLIMPVMNGIEATREIMAHTPCAILVVTGSVGGNAGMVFDAMSAGALDAVNTPIVGLDGRGTGSQDLLNKIRTIARLIEPDRRRQVASQRPRPASTSVTTCVPLVAIGASTGGPGVLAEIFAQLPADFPAAIAVIQHVDAQFADSFASWLDGQCALNVRLARAGDTFSSGDILVAGTSDHLIINPDRVLEYTPEPKSYPYRPSVDVFFHSVAKHGPESALGVLLTGMGRDGAAGMLAMQKRGIRTIAQDKDSCTVYGMPKAAIELGAASDIMNVEQIIAAVLEFGHSRKTQTAKAV